MCFKVFVIFIFSLISLPVSADTEQTRIGYAYDKKTNELVYKETHFEHYEDGLIQSSRVIYRDASDKIIANKTVDFTKNSFMPEFALKNNENGHKEVTRYVKSEYEVIFSKKEASIEEQIRLNYPKDGISDAGFDNFIIKNWDELVADKIFKREFLIPSMMKFIKFRIYQNETIEEDGGLFRVINIEPDNFLIRAFAGTTKLFYTKNEPRLVKFDGVSNMRDKNGNNYKVMIRYEKTKKLASKEQ